MSFLIRLLLVSFVCMVLAHNASAEEFTLECEWVLLDFSDSPNLIPTVIERKKSKNVGETDGHWLLTMVPHANVDWVNRVRQSISKAVSLTCRHNLTSDKPISGQIDLDRYIVSVSATLGSADGNGAHPVELGLCHRPKISPPKDPAKLSRKQILMTPGEPKMFAFSFSRLEADGDGNATDYRVECWIVTLNHKSDGPDS